MCGIAGFTRLKDNDTDNAVLTDMANAIYHRGPDAGGVFIDEDIALCHRRLSIIDLSAAGNQPMWSSSGRYIIVYNGEVYNFPELRKELESQGVLFNTKTDTEVILALYEREGVESLKRLNGMFAFAIWDKSERSLFLARDRLGKKPLYFYNCGTRFVFASEIKSILKAPDIKRDIRSDALKDYFFYQYVPDPKTIFEGIHKLEPGHWLKVSDGNITKQQYWDVSFANTHPKSKEEMQADAYNLLEDSVRLRMVSDVPLGAFLSGGIDSSAIVGMMASNSATPITTCSIGFSSKEFDEVYYAKKVAERFQTNHRELTVKENVEDNLLKIASYFDEPFADPSFVPTFFVSQLARQVVTVALAGDGGDEEFAGYSKYTVDQVENNLRRLVPAIVRSAFFPPLSRLLSHSDNTYLRKGSSLLATLSLDPDRSFFVTNSFFNEQLWSDIVTGDFERETIDYDASEISKYYYNKADTDDHLSKILYTDLKTYLPGDILVKVDRMSMANSLETRAPFLDYRLVEYAASIPSSLKLKDGEKKYILKKSLDELLSDEILYRKKMGFSVPLAQWLQHDIYQIAKKYLFGPDSGISQYFDMGKLTAIWDAHQEGKRSYASELWSFLIFELWWQNYIKEQ
ncbi:MAG: asparagine synthase (glutamine-hydrolyzing) [Pseudomonadales bacterium]